MRRLALAAAAICVTASPAAASPFEKDHRFGRNGSVSVHLGERHFIRDVEVDANAALVAVNTDQFGGPDSDDGALVRVLESGRLDGRFGDGGILDTALEGRISDFAVDSARERLFVLLGDDEILAIDRRGDPVTDWATGGSLTVDFPASSVAATPDGGLIVSGRGDEVLTDANGQSRMAIAVAQRFDSSGQRDLGYGTDGEFADTRDCVVVRILRCPRGGIEDSAVAPDGSLTLAGFWITACGNCPNPPNDYVKIVDPAGFGAPTRATPSECARISDAAYDIAVGPAGNPLVAGFCAMATSYVLSPDPEAAGTWGSDGLLRYPQSLRIRSIDVDNRNRVVVLGTDMDSRQIELRRVTPVGEPARGFERGPQVMPFREHSLVSMGRSLMTVAVGSKRIQVSRYLDQVGDALRARLRLVQHPDSLDEARRTGFPALVECSRECDATIVVDATRATAERLDLSNRRLATSREATLGAREQHVLTAKLDPTADAELSTGPGGRVDYVVRLIASRADGTGRSMVVERRRGLAGS